MNVAKLRPGLGPSYTTVYQNTGWLFIPDSFSYQISSTQSDMKILAVTMLLWFVKIYERNISNSLIIHKIKTQEINTETEFGYVMKHLHKIKPTFILIFPLNTDLFEMLYQTLGRVFHQDIETPRSC